MASAICAHSMRLKPPARREARRNCQAIGALPAGFTQVVASWEDLQRQGLQCGEALVAVETGLE